MISKAFNKIKAYAYSKAIEKKLKLKINIFTTPTSWYERLTILSFFFNWQIIKIKKITHG